MIIPKGYKLVPAELLESLLDDPAIVVRMSSDKIVAIKSALLAADATPPQPIYDEAKERELFEARLGSMMKKRNPDGSYVYLNIEDQWAGWECCAQSRAKTGEVVHE